MLTAMQAKHSLTEGVLTQYSVELWRTLRVWSQLISDRPGDYGLVLITTSTLANDIGAFDLRAEASAADREVLLNVLDAIAVKKSNQALLSAYEAWEQLPAAMRRDLLLRAKVVSGAPQLEHISKQLENAVRRHHIREADVTSASQQIEGWFIQLVSKRLGVSGCEVAFQEAWDFIHEEHRKYHAVAAPPEPADASGEAKRSARILLGGNATFLQQLRVLSAEDAQLEEAAGYFSRARVARQRWLDEAAISRTQIVTFATELIDHWRTESSAASRRITADPQDRALAGWRIHDQCMAHRPPFGPTVAPKYLTIGSYHMLADEPSLGWHPDYRSLLKVDDESQ